MPSWLIITAVMIVSFVLSQALFASFSRKDSVRGRVAGLRRSGVVSGGNDGSVESRGSVLTLEPEMTDLAKVLQSILRVLGMNPDKYSKEHGIKFYRAGFLKPEHPIYFLAYRVFCGPAVALFGLWNIFYNRKPNGDMNMLSVVIGLILVVFGLYGAQLWIKNSQQKREKKLVNSFPDSLDLLLVCVETGLALDGALGRVCRELGRTAPEITEELNRTRLELSLLNDRQQALLNLAHRTNLAPFKTLVGALLQSERMGTSLTDTLRVLSEDYRMRRLMDAETRAGRLPAIMTIPLILCMLPALFMIILGPAILTVMSTNFK